MAGDEAYALLVGLANDPSSRLYASINEWDYPWSHEALILANLYDLIHKQNAGKKKPEPYARPFPLSGSRQTFKGTPMTMTQLDELRAMVLAQSTPSEE